MGNGWCFVHPHQGEEEKQKQEQRGAPGWLGEEETKIIVQNFIGELEKGPFCEQTVTSQHRTSQSPISKFHSHQHPLSCCKTWGKREGKKCSFTHFNAKVSFW